jgi:hypothetical protein
MSSGWNLTTFPFRNDRRSCCDRRRSIVRSETWNKSATSFLVKSFDIVLLSARCVGASTRL